MKINWETEPLYVKAKEIQRLVDSIVEVVYDAQMNFGTEEEGDLIDESINYLIENSVLIPTNTIGILNEDVPYDLRMENATVVRRAARELLTDADSIQSFGFKNIEYLNVLRIAIDEFRIMFAEWVKTFDPWNYVIDRWGLFNPPGINYNDHNPDDDLPSNSFEDKQSNHDWDGEIDDDDDDIVGEGDEDDDTD